MTEDEWREKFNRDISDAFDCEHARQYLAEITVLSDPHARVQCTRCGRIFEMTGDPGGAA
jgi:ribosomal protein S27E